MRAGNRGLHDHRVPEVRGRDKRFFDRLGAAFGDEWEPVRPQERSRLVRCQPPVLHLRHDRARSVAIDAGKLGNAPLSAPQPLGARGNTSERARRRFGIRKRRRSTGKQCCGRAAAADHRREHRLVHRSRRLERTRDRHRDLLCAGDDRRHEQHDHGVDSRIREHDRQDTLVCLGGRGSEHVHRIGEARFDGDDLPQCVACARGKLRKRETRGFARVRTEDPETAGIRKDGDVASARQRLPREQRRDIQQLFERLDPQHTRLVEERVDRRFRARERRRVRARRACSRCRSAGLHRDNRLRASDSARNAPELARVAERLEVEHDDLGVRVLLPVLEQVVGRDVGLVPDRHEGGEPERLLGRLLEQREAERATLRGEADPPCRQRPRREGRVQADRRHCDAEAVRAEQARAVRAHERKQALLAVAALAARLGEAR